MNSKTLQHDESSSLASCVQAEKAFRRFVPYIILYNILYFTRECSQSFTSILFAHSSISGVSKLRSAKLFIRPAKPFSKLWSAG